MSVRMMLTLVIAFDAGVIAESFLVGMLTLASLTLVHEWVDKLAKETR